MTHCTETCAQVVGNFAAPPLIHSMLLTRVEGGMCVVSVGGNEGDYPGRDPAKRSAEDVIQFAAQVRGQGGAGASLAGVLSSQGQDSGIKTGWAPAHHAHC